MAKENKTTLEMVSVRMTRTDQLNYRKAIFNLNLKRKQTGGQKLFTSRLVNKLFVELTKDPQKVLDFLQYDDKN